MDMRNTDRIEDLPEVETPKDVAVLYSWANLSGAKYRDFSASRREFRAQARHRAAEQVREAELEAKQEAEIAAEHAEAIAREAERIAAERQEFAEERQELAAEDIRLETLRQAEEAARIASAERIEAARRAEAAALAEAIARREEREIAEAHASAERQTARYAESERHRRQLEAAQPPSPIPGQISDPYTTLPHLTAQTFSHLPSTYSPAAHPVAPPLPSLHLQPVRMVPEPLRPLRPDDRTSTPPPSPLEARSKGRPRLEPRPHAADGGHERDFDSDVPHASYHADDNTSPLLPQRNVRPRGHRLEDASDVRRMARDPEWSDTDEAAHDTPASHAPRPAQRPPADARPSRSRGRTSAAANRREWTEGDHASREQFAAEDSDPHPDAAQTAGAEPDADPTGWDPPAQPGAASPARRNRRSAPATRGTGTVPPGPQHPLPAARPANELRTRSADRRVDAAPSHPGEARRRQQTSPAQRPRTPGHLSREHEARAHATEAISPASSPAAPAWRYGPGQRHATSASAEQMRASDTLQQSRERVASRWYALQGVFEQTDSAESEIRPRRRREPRTPVLAVVSLAGGVGKTSLVATLGRSLSSLGEKVLLTDTTTHGLLPFYFGANELRHGVVRTFTPPSGSADAPIDLVSYDADAYRHDEHAEGALAEEITASSRGAHRVLLDLHAASSWIIRRLALENPTILIPVAPDMNSVISLKTVENLVAEVTDAEGQPARTFFLLNHFDASLPLHLDVREVLRQRLGNRLLPFVIRRAPVVSEALAEGMTVVDYAPEDAVAGDYLHVAKWLRTLAAPAAASFRNARWSER